MMDFAVSHRGAVQIVTFAGSIDRTASGTVYDLLLKSVGWKGAKLAIDLSRVTRLTRAGARGLIVAAKLASRTGGEVRICGAKPMIFVFMRGLGFESFIKLDRSLDEGLALLGPDGGEAGADPAELEKASPRRGPFVRVATFFRAVREQQSRRRDYRRLLEMPDHLLIDVGLTPFKVRTQMHRPFFPLIVDGLSHGHPEASPQRGE